MQISSARLTTCDVVLDGHLVVLNLVDDKGNEVCLRLPFDQAQAIAMTLPTLLARALQALTGTTSARYVFPLDRWAVEQSEDSGGLLLTLATADGFHVSFGIPAQACKGLGRTLANDADRPVSRDGLEKREVGSPFIIN